MLNNVRVASQTHGRVRAGTRVQVLQSENRHVKVRVVSVGWNQGEVYVVPKSILGIFN
jgi:hypothetical protein